MKQTAQVIFGSDSPLVNEERIAVVQTLSGTGALRVAAEFIAMYSPGALVYISDPSWGNHHTIFRKAGLQVRSNSVLSNLSCCPPCFCAEGALLAAFRCRECVIRGRNPRRTQRTAFEAAAGVPRKARAALRRAALRSGCEATGRVAAGVEHGLGSAPKSRDFIRRESRTFPRGKIRDFSRRETRISPGGKAGTFPVETPERPGVDEGVHASAACGPPRRPQFPPAELV